jgi:hypothetical protein
MSHGIDERYAIYDERTLRANKPHTCDACGIEILKFDRYTRVFWLFQGRKHHVKRCLRCQLLHEHLRALNPSEMWPDEELGCGTLYEDEWGTPPDWVNELAFWRPGDPLPATNGCTPPPNTFLCEGPLLGCWQYDWRTGRSRATERCQRSVGDWQRVVDTRPHFNPCTEAA